MLERIAISGTTPDSHKAYLQSSNSEVPFITVYLSRIGHTTPDLCGKYLFP
jgi:hypothetical protein